MGERGPAPKRDAERHHPTQKPVGGDAQKFSPADLAAFGYDVDLNPLPPVPEQLRPLRNEEGKRVPVELDEHGWHPFATHLWESLLRDPSRKWTGGAQMALNLAMVESISRMLMPRVAGWSEEYDAAGKLIDKSPVWESKPMSGSEMNAVLAWAKQVGLDEKSRLNLRKEITFYDPDDITPEQAAELGGAGVVAITRNRQDALRGGTA